MKKFLAILLALVIVLGLCACGGNNAGTGNEGNGGDDVSADGKMTISVGITSNAKILSYDENDLTRWVEDQCNVELEFVEYAGGTDVSTQISTTIAARQELPDFLFGIALPATTMNRYGRDGYLYDLKEYYDDREGASKTFWTRLEENFSEAEIESILRKITDPTDGGMYVMPNIETSLVDTMHYQTWINREWLDKLGLDKPTDNASLVKVLEAFRDNDCNGNGDPNDEIPLFGSTQAGNSGNVVNWLINLFQYYNSASNWSVDENGKLYANYTTDEYREALEFVNYLYEEKLLTSLAWTASSNEMKQITTPSSGTALCGIFCGHLTIHTVANSEVLYQYEPLQTWGYAVSSEPSPSLTSFISGDVSKEKADKIFEIMMLLWSEEGSRRIRYGAKGANWDEPTEGAVSPIGLPAEYRLIRDAIQEQNTALWSKVSCTLNLYAEGETAELQESDNPWQYKKFQMHAESYKLFSEQAERKNPKTIVPTLVLSEEESEATTMERTNVGNRYAKAQTEFCSGTVDLNDTTWAAYLKELDDLGLQTWRDQAQEIFDRQ